MFQLLPVRSINSGNFMFSNFKSDHFPPTSKNNYVTFKVKHTENHMGKFCIRILYLKTISEILVFISILLIFNSDYFPWVTCSFIWSPAQWQTLTKTQRLCTMCSKAQAPQRSRKRIRHYQGVIVFNCNYLSSLCSRFKLKMGIELQTVN